MTDHPPSVVLLGNGHLADRLPFRRVNVIERLSRTDVDGIVVVGPRGDVVERHLATAEVPWLPVRMDAGWVTVGPLVRPGATGCPLCVARRRFLNREDAEPRRRLRRDRLPSGAGEAGTPPAVTTVIAALAAEQFGPATRTERAILRVSVLDGSIRRHRFLPDPSCPRCGGLPPDSAAAALRQRVRLPLPAAGTFRLRSLDDRAAELRELYVDPETGMIASLDAAWLGGVVTAVARRAPGRNADDAQHGYGRAEHSGAARIMAVVEALERGATERPGARRSVVRGSYAELASDAIDPRTLGTPSDDLYALPDYPFIPVASDQETDWVWGHSFQSGAPVLVPETVAYYGRAGDPAWFAETSNGCAVGSCFDEAVLYGLLEVAERDAFLMTWYGRLPLPRVGLRTAADRRIPVLAGLIEQRFDCRVMVFAALMEQRIPAFVTLAVHREEGAGPAVACTAAAHIDPEHAVLSALRELGPLLHGLRARYDPGAVEPLLTSPALLTEMDQHTALYTHPATRARVDFLTTGGARVTLDSVTEQAAWPRHTDLADHLDELTSRYAADGMEVLAVNTTSRELSAGGFAAAKVIVPGTLPMTFGHPYRRTRGLPRILSTPRRLGYRKTDLSFDELNPDPHPFP